mgnify:CR=1 FL=1
MASVMSTVLSRLNAFLDSELEQVLCFDSAIDAEKFASEKSAIFLILPEEDTTKNFMAGLMIQNLSRELFAVADENGGKLQNRVVLYCDEFGTMPPFDVLPLFSAGRSRRLTLVPFDVRLIDRALLSEDEIVWINSYHAEVREAVKAHLSDHEIGWLLQATAPI